MLSFLGFSGTCREDYCYANIMIQQYLGTIYVSSYDLQYVAVICAGITNLLCVEPLGMGRHLLWLAAEI